jgi:hypothetical protein
MSKGVVLEQDGLARPEPGTLVNLFYTKQIVGSPDECIRGVQALQGNYHPDELVLHMVYGDMALDVARRSVDLVA